MGFCYHFLCQNPGSLEGEIFCCVCVRGLSDISPQLPEIFRTCSRSVLVNYSVHVALVIGGDDVNELEMLTETQLQVCGNISEPWWEL